MGMALERKGGKAEAGNHQRSQTSLTGREAIEAGDNGTVLPEMKLAGMLRCRVRCFTDGAVIGSKAFVNEAFVAARERFTERRKDGARRMKGNGKAADEILWSARDLRVRV
jgi:putative transposase